MVVFFFCSDIALYALQTQAVHIFGQLLSWSTDFITGRFSQFIRDHGGWVKTSSLLAIAVILSWLCREQFLTTQ